jgi:hypothetical protein
MRMKTEHKSGIASVTVAAATAAVTLFLGLWDGDAPAPKGNTVGDVSGNTGPVTIIQSSAAGDPQLDSSPNEGDADFIGALDGRYRMETGSLGMVDADADFNAGALAFIVGNCAFDGVLEQKGASWLFYLKTTDGICSFLDELPTGKPLVRVIPLPGALANSGRVLEFFVESGEFAIDPISGTYRLAEGDD